MLSLKCQKRIDLFKYNVHEYEENEGSDQSVYRYGSDYNLQASRYKCVFENYFTYFSIKTHVVGTQKKVSNETVLLSTQNTCLNQ